jgi:hypothetical protein
VREEGPVHAAQYGERLGAFLAGEREDALGLGDRRGDRGRADQIGGVGADPFAESVLVEMIGHRIDEGDLGIAGCLQVAREVRGPGRGPVAGDLRATGMVVRIDEQDPHGRPPGSASSGLGKTRRDLSRRT